MQMYDYESKERQAAEARKALGLPSLQSSILEKIIESRGRGKPVYECHRVMIPEQWPPIASAPMDSDANTILKKGSS